MIEENIELLEENKNYCWPMYYNNINELLEKLKQGKHYVISSSDVLSGWVAAKNIKVKLGNI